MLRAYRKAAEAQINNLKEKIKKIQIILESPYIKYKERPYHLHTVIVHDGLATNGHYYSYVFDRVSQKWWMLNDHRALMVSEEQVMTEAYGGSGYKSACNLFYVSNHIVEEMNKLKHPIYSRNNFSNFNIPKTVKYEQEELNGKFILSM